ncbi:hypothetical protein EYF80_030527 [Liparis tanakae]|uniref:Uncharacterized protein n=1 Tax=Liparis tanakae TaxID=230148 RepID=A0A4Z2H304_9TELE|nr:hypothetical protein EYF80_030527 [Liparis tanakae]
MRPSHRWRSSWLEVQRLEASRACSSRCSTSRLLRLSTEQRIRRASIFSCTCWASSSETKDKPTTFGPSSSATPFRTLTVLVTMGSPPLSPDGYSVTSRISVTTVSVTSVTSVTSRDARVFQDQGLPSLESLLWKLALLSADVRSGKSSSDLTCLDFWPRQPGRLMSSAPLPFFFVVGAVIEEFPFLVNVPADGIARPDGDNVFQTAQRTPSQEQFFTWRSDGAGSMCGGEAVAFPPAPAPLLLLLRLLLYQAARRQNPRPSSSLNFYEK